MTGDTEDSITGGGGDKATERGRAAEGDAGADAGARAPGAVPSADEGMVNVGPAATGTNDTFDLNGDD